MEKKILYSILVSVIFVFIALYILPIPFGYVYNNFEISVFMFALVIFIIVYATQTILDKLTILENNFKNINSNEKEYL